MVEAATRAQEEFSAKVESMVDKVHQALMPATKSGLVCALKCFDQHKDHKQVSICMEGCQKPFEELGENVNRELMTIQTNVDSCMQDLHSRMAPRMMSMVESDKPALDQEMAQGFSRCFQTVEPQLKEVEERLMFRIKQARY
eukprot:TRINITY_DN4775_c0_g1_i1.p3 TRINITY_DN4775_c0_g1~~TRINITY_DN4775_c0_g1_i1.p3  ORF type:complete len:142 (-),score=44.43 TRINITY_DN4775_c0_g1_i1:244-669(-)